MKRLWRLVPSRVLGWLGVSAVEELQRRKRYWASKICPPSVDDDL